MMKNLKEINQLLEGELNYLYGFNLGKIYFNSLEAGDIYENFYIQTMEDEHVYIKHLAGYLFIVEKGNYAIEKNLNVSPALFELLKSVSITRQLEKQIETLQGLIKDTERRISDLKTSRNFYRSDLEKMEKLLSKLEVNENENI